MELKAQIILRSLVCCIGACTDDTDHGTNEVIRSDDFQVEFPAMFHQILKNKALGLTFRFRLFLCKPAIDRGQNKQSKQR